MSDRFASANLAVRAMWMRGGTSKGLYFLKEDLPETGLKDFLLRVMGSPDPTQIDGIGGANPLTSKVAIVSKSDRPGIDVDYRFLQVFVDQTIVTDAQNCGNILAGIGPFAIERGLVEASEDPTIVNIFMENTGKIARAAIRMRDGLVQYQGGTQIDGVPGSAASIPISFTEIAGSSCGALLPTGNAADVIGGTRLTMIDNGMPCVLINARDLNLTGRESPEKLETNSTLRAALEELRIKCGKLMNLGDVARSSVPKMTIVSEPVNGGVINTRTFIPHRCHNSIGAMGAISVATACLHKGTVAAQISELEIPAHLDSPQKVLIEHPSGATPVIAKKDPHSNRDEFAIIRTARKLIDGTVFA